MIRKVEPIINFLKGIVVGVANVIPGVSGGTMALVMGIYKRLVEAIGKFITNRPKRKEYFFFLLTVFCGAIFGIVAFAKVLSFLLSSKVFAQPTYFFFIGLILGSIPFLVTIHSDMKVSLSRALFFVIGLGLVILVALVGGKNNPIDTPRLKFTFLNVFNITSINPKYAFWLFFCGLAASSSMIIPGVSGSALLLGLGEYRNVLYFVNELMIIPLVFFGIGVVAGVVGCSRLIDYCLEKYPSNTYYFIIGLVVASIFQVVMQSLGSFSLSFLPILLSIVTLGLGFVIAYRVSKIKKPQ